MKRFSLINSLLLAALAAVVIAALVSTWEPVERLELKLYDMRAALASKSSLSSIVIVSIDQESANRLGGWPWPRTYFARAIHQLQERGAKQIGLSVLYAEKDPNPGLREIRDIIRKIETEPGLLKPGQITALFPQLQETEKQQIRKAIVSSSLSALRNVVLPLLKEAENRIDSDTALLNAFAAAPNIVQPIAFVLGERGAKKALPIPDYLQRNSLPARGTERFSTSDTLSAPLPEYARLAAALGHINALRDSDGTVRSDLPFIASNNRLYPSFGLQLALKELNLSLQDVRIEETRIILGDRIIPLLDGKKIRIIPRAASAYPIVSFADLADGTVDADAFRNKVVLIGHRHNMPFEMLPAQPAGLLPSVDTVANVIDVILSKSFVSRPSWAVAVESSVIALLALMLAAFGGARLRLALIASLGILLIWTAISFSLFLTQGVWLKIAYPIVFFVLALGVLIIRTALTPQRYEDAVGSEFFNTADFRVRFAAKTDTGTVRDRNEDSYCADKHLGLLAVADGVGGRASGAVASRMAADLVTEHLKKGFPDVSDAAKLTHSDLSETTKRLGMAVMAANKSVHSTAELNPQLRNMGTTLTAVLFDGNRASIAHVGDCRAYLIRHISIEQLTDDHTVAAEHSKKGLSEDMAQMRHMLTRAVGIAPDIVPDVDELALAEGDILIICSDGLFNMVSDGEILAVVKSTSDPFRACTRLVDLANSNGGRDNITVVVAYIEKRR
ncbi:MAG TPA: CHASE2 domain-containing protein [Dissulfurispiraceae bacterium]|nr:CHASE2 domain-containing protein [Dissulfurispiraceae bacterium]